MEIEIIKVKTSGDIETEHVFITHDNGTITSMPKSVYDEQQAALKDAAN